MFNKLIFALLPSLVSKNVRPLHKLHPGHSQDSLMRMRKSQYEYKVSTCIIYNLLDCKHEYCI